MCEDLSCLCGCSVSMEHTVYERMLFSEIIYMGFKSVGGIKLFFTSVDLLVQIKGNYYHSQCYNVFF